MLYYILGYLGAVVAFYAWILCTARPDPREEPAAEIAPAAPEEREAPVAAFPTRASISG